MDDATSYDNWGDKLLDKFIKEYTHEVGKE